VLTLHSIGLIDGSGEKWWGAVKYLEIGENRPRLIHIEDAADLKVENLFFKNSPYWTFYANDVANVEIHHCRVDARRDNSDHHDLYDLTAFNTDGFDVAGKDIWIHDCEIWNDDDCIAVKEMNGGGKRAQCSENMLFERINASGVGLTIGSIGPSSLHTCVRNITFRDCVMPNSYKGIYMKSRPGSPGETGEITRVLYENIRIESPTQWAIWIGPQQASYSDSCSLLWPFDPFAACPVPAEITWSDITLRNVTVITSSLSPGVLIGNETNPMQNIVFDNVRAIDCGVIPWFGRYVLLRTIYER
jgi:polygalacturonase